MNRFFKAFLRTKGDKRKREDSGDNWRKQIKGGTVVFRTTESENYNADNKSKMKNSDERIGTESKKEM